MFLFPWYYYAPCISCQRIFEIHPHTGVERALAEEEAVAITLAGHLSHPFDPFTCKGCRRSNTLKAITMCCPWLREESEKR